MPVVKIILEESERDALHMLARGEKRDPRAQAALLIRAELERRGLLAREPMTANGAPIAGVEITPTGREGSLENAKEN